MNDVTGFLDAITSACRGKTVVDPTLKSAMVEAADDTEVDETSEAAIFMAPPASSDAIAALDERCRRVSGAACPPALAELLGHHDGIWPRIELRGRVIDLASWEPSKKEGFDRSDRIFPVRSILAELDFLNEQVTDGPVGLVPFSPIVDQGWVCLDVRDAGSGVPPAVNVYFETMGTPDRWERTADSLGQWLHRWMQSGFMVWFD